MYQTLYSIPEKIWGLPVFGFGLLLAVWAVASAAFVVWLVRRYGLGAETRGYLPVIVLCGAAILFVLPLVEDAQRQLPIRGYGVMMLLGIVLAVMLAVHRAPAARIDPEIVFSLAFWVVAAGMFGARLFHVIEYWNPVYHQPTLGETLIAIINVPKGGLVVYGSVIAVTLMFPLFAWRHRIPWLALADLVAPSFMIGLALGRIGCLLNGCCYGGPTDYRWAIRFPERSLPYQEQLLTGMLHGFRIEQDAQGRLVVGAKGLAEGPRAAGLKAGDEIVAINGEQVDSRVVAGRLNQKGMLAWSGGPIDRLAVAHVLMSLSGPELSLKTADGRTVGWSIGQLPTRSLPVHPTQIYSSFDAVLICLLLLAYYPFRRRDGEVGALLISIYPVTRFLIECLRIDEPKQFGPSLTIGQVVSIAALAGAVGLWIYLLRQPTGRLWAQIGPVIGGRAAPRTA